MPAQKFEPFTAAVLGECGLTPRGKQSMFLNAWYPTIMLAFEAGNVIDVRLRKIALGGAAGADESHLMVKEKLDAAFEAASILIGGGNLSHVIDNYRKHVAANAVRLTPARKISSDFI